MSSIDISTLGVSKIITSSDSTSLYVDVSMNSGNIYVGDLKYPKQGLVFNNVKYYGSKTEFSLDGSYVVARTDNDPYPSKAGASLGYLYSTPTNDITTRSWYDDPNPLCEQSSVYTFTYRGGTNTDSSSIFMSSGGTNGIFTNGAAFLSPLGGFALPTVSDMRFNTSFYVNAYYFMNFLGKDLAGHPEEGGQYHYHTGGFLYNMWNNSTFYNSISYYKDTYYSLPSGIPSPYYNKAIYSDSGNSTTDHMRHADGHSKIVGFCFDGYPIYGPFGYTDSISATGGLKLMTSNYSLKTSAASGRPYGYTEYASLVLFINMIAPQSLGHPHSYYNNSSDLSRNRVLMGPGAYSNDYEYQATNGGTLDVYNGKYTKTPDYPNGTYAYFLTLDANGIPQYPYAVGNYSKQQRTFTKSTSQYCTITSGTSSLLTNDTATITFTMSKSTTTFTASDITVSGGGSLSNFSGSGTIYTATYTPPTNTSTSVTITVAANTFTDASGNKNYVSNTLSLSVNTVVTVSNVSAHTLKYISDITHVNALMIDFTDYQGALFKWTKSTSYDGTYTDDYLVDGTVNTTQYHHITGSDMNYFFKAQIKNSSDTTYNTVAIIYINNNGYMGIVLDGSVTSIVDGAFARGIGKYSDTYGVYKIANIFIPKSVTRIGNYAFSVSNNTTDSIETFYIESGSTFTSTSKDSGNNTIFLTSSTVKTGASLSDIISTFTSSLSNTTNSPVEGAMVYYVDTNGTMLSNSPIAYTDAYGDFVIATSVYVNGTEISFANEPLKVTGGKNTLTGQSITYWYAKSGTKTMTPVTNLLFYCRENSDVTNDTITRSIGIDNGNNFSNYNYYKLLINTTDKTSTPYIEALKSNNLGNVINVFATIGAYFLWGINGSNLDTEYDAMMRSIANISTGGIGTPQYNPDNNQFAQLFGKDQDKCTAIITDRLKNKITNTDLLNNTDPTTTKNYAELFASILAERMSEVMTTIMSSDNIDTTADYETIGYNVVPYVYDLITALKPALNNPINNKNDILYYFTRNLASIFKTVTNNHFNTIYNNGTVSGFSNAQTVNNTRSSEQVMMRRQVVKAWNTAYANGIVNGVSRIVTPFRAITNSGDFLQRENYVCGGPNQVNADKPGWKGHIGSIISNCDYSGIPSSTCNIKYVPDSSDYIKYKKLRANNQNYNDLKNGGYQNSAYVDLMRVRRR